MTYAEDAETVAVVVQPTEASGTAVRPGFICDLEREARGAPTPLVLVTAPRTTLTARDDAELLPSIASIPAWEKFIGAIFVVSATDELSDALVDTWEHCDDIGLPRAIVISDIDRSSARTEELIEDCQEALGDMVPALASHLPVLSDDDQPVGLIDLLDADIIDYSSGTITREPASVQHLDLVRDERSWLIEAIIAETDDESLVTAYLSKQPLDKTALTDEFFRVVARGRLHPILLTAGSPARLGLEQIQQVIARGFPRVTRSSP